MLKIVEVGLISFFKFYIFSFIIVMLIYVDVFVDVIVFINYLIVSYELYIHVLIIYI